MAKKFPIYPAHPERTCWGCDRYCAADAMICGNGTERTQHPVELFGEGWEHEGLDPVRPEPPQEPQEPQAPVVHASSPVPRDP
jgi:hypothetical protein